MLKLIGLSSAAADGAGRGGPRLLDGVLREQGEPGAGDAHAEVPRPHARGRREEAPVSANHVVRISSQKMTKKKQKMTKNDNGRAKNDNGKTKNDNGKAKNDRKEKKESAQRRKSHEGVKGKERKGACVSFVCLHQR